MYETLIIFILFMIIDVVFSIKRVPLFAFMFGTLQFLLCFAYLLPDTEFSIYLTLVFGVMAGLMMLINGLDLRK